MGFTRPHTKRDGTEVSFATGGYVSQRRRYPGEELSFQESELGDHTVPGLSELSPEMHNMEQKQFLLRKERIIRNHEY